MQSQRKWSLVNVLANNMLDARWMQPTNNHLSHAVRSTWYSACFTEEEYAAVRTMETLMTELQIIGRGYEVIHPYTYIRTKETVWGNSVMVIIITVSFRLASFHPKKKLNVSQKWLKRMIKIEYCRQCVILFVGKWICL